MHDYEFIVSLPKSSVSAPKPVESVPEPVKKNGNFDWMDEDSGEAPKAIVNAAPPQASSAPSTAPTFSTTIKSRPLCKYGEKCYQTNPQHLAKYAHPHRENATKETPPPSSTSAPPSAAPIIKEPSKVESIPENDFGKRPKPALDLMDEEEDFLPKSKKPKSLASTASSSKQSSGKSGGLDMSWMDVDEESSDKTVEPEIRTKEETSSASSDKQSNGTSIKPKPSSLKSGGMTLDELLGEKQPANNSKVEMDVVQPSSSSQTSVTQPRSTTSTPTSSQSTFLPSSSQPKSQKSTTSITSSNGESKVSSSSNSAVQVSDVATMKEWIAKKVDESLKAKHDQNGAQPTRTVVLLPWIISNSFVQEILDVMIEYVDEYGREEQAQLKSHLRVSEPTSRLEKYATRFWYAPPEASYAAAFRRRLMTEAKREENNGTNSGLLPLTSYLKMAPPSLKLVEIFQHITNEEKKFDVQWQGEPNRENTSSSSDASSHSFNLVIINDSLWRFKGIGLRTSMGPQLHAAVDSVLRSAPSPSHKDSSQHATTLWALTKLSFEVGEPGKAFPIRLPKLPAQTNMAEQIPGNTTMIIHVVHPDLLDQGDGMPKEVEAKWRACILSALSALPV